MFIFVNLFNFLFLARPDLKETIDLTNEESNEDIIDLTDDLLESSSEDINSKSNDKVYFICIY